MMDKAHLRFTLFKGKRLHLGVTGSIAAYKALELMRAWQKAGVTVGVTLTESALEFVTPTAFGCLGADPVHTKIFDGYTKPFPHLMPGQEADAFVIAPATASTIEAVASGRADGILCCQALAYDRPIVFAAAMNTLMWNNPATRANWETLRKRGHDCIDPGSGLLACGTVGDGHIADLSLIYLHGLKAMSPQDLSGVNVMLTIGPTREYWDGVRFWSNASSGVMGASLAVAAWMRGASVHAVCGPGTPWLPPDINRLDVVSSQEMHNAAHAIWDEIDESGEGRTLGIFTAAVADFRPDYYGPEKFKKNIRESDAAQIEKNGSVLLNSDASIGLRFLRNPDILSSIGAKKKEGQYIIGFAAETDNLVQNAREKLERKNMDMLVANLVNVPGNGFESSSNAVTVLSKGGAESWESMTKPDLAWRILDWYCRHCS